MLHNTPKFLLNYFPKLLASFFFILLNISFFHSTIEFLIMPKFKLNRFLIARSQLKYFFSLFHFYYIIPSIRHNFFLEWRCLPKFQASSLKHFFINR
jgi:hypothetical protein